MTANQNLPGLLDRGDIQAVFQPPDKRFRKGGPPSRDLVEVDPRLRVMTRMKILRGPITAQDVDVVRQKVVESPPQFHRVDRFPASEMSDLGDSVNSGIGAAGPPDLRFSQKLTGHAKHVTL